MATKVTEETPVQALERLTRLIRAGEHAADLNPAQWSALRYLSRCNRFSNSPAALTRYLGATKGTVSQTLIALERKGLIVKSARPGEARSISLSLTAEGTQRLADDPWNALEDVIAKAGGKTRKKLASASQTLLILLIKSQDLPSFGTCRSCRYFRENGAPADVKGKHWCLQFEEVLTRQEAGKICASHEPA